MLINYTFLRLVSSESGSTDSIPKTRLSGSANPRHMVWCAPPLWWPASRPLFPRAGVRCTSPQEGSRSTAPTTTPCSGWLSSQINELRLRVEHHKNKVLQCLRENGLMGVDDKQNIVTLA